MLKMLKVVITDMEGNKRKVSTYAQDTSKPEEVFKDFLFNGGEITECEWLDTLSEHRKKWNEENPDNQIPVDA